MTLIQQQRLIGAILLLCFISVIAYFLLARVEESQPAQPQEEPIAFNSVIEPIAEDVEGMEAEEETLVDPQNLAENQTTETDSVTELAEETVAALSLPPETAPAPAPAPATVDSQLWVLQLASFSVRSNADSLAAQLKKMGYAPVIETTATGGTPIHRVRLQPMSDRTKLEQTAESLSKKLNLSTQILQHKP